MCVCVYYIDRDVKIAKTGTPEKISKIFMGIFQLDRNMKGVR